MGSDSIDPAITAILVAKLIAPSSNTATPFLFSFVSPQ